MITYLKNNKFDFTIITAFMIFGILSFSLDYQPGIVITRDNFATFMAEMLSFLPLMFILIGLLDVWIPKHKAEKHIGKDSGLKGSLSMVLLAMLQAGPLYGAFPVTAILWKKGASIRNVFIYIGAFCTLKIPMLTFEVGFLGLKFTLLRTILTLPVFYLIAVILEKYLQNKNFEVQENK